MIFVVNDLHGHKNLIDKTVSSINRMSTNDTLIINGDGAGARGPIMNNLVKIFYEVRRGETDKGKLISALTDIIGEKPEIPDSWIFDSVHAGLFRAIVSKKYDTFRQCVESELISVLKETIRPLSQAAKRRGVKILYSPGNGEITPADFSTDDITVEKSLPPEERFYHRLATDGFFEKVGIEYVPYAAYNFKKGVGIISANLLDLRKEDQERHLKNCGLLDHSIGTLVTHYPASISPLGNAFQFWTPNKVDRTRIEALDRIMKKLKIQSGAIIFGHIHLSPEEMAPYPTMMGFEFPNNNMGIWLKPGSVIKVSN